MPSQRHPKIFSLQSLRSDLGGAGDPLINSIETLGPFLKYYVYYVVFDGFIIDGIVFKYEY